MTIALAEVGRRGSLHLTFACNRSRTEVRDVYCEVPFKITRLHYSSRYGIAHLILMHSTAGIFGGDYLDCSIHVGAGARVLLTQQSASKVHPGAQKCAIQRNSIHVEAGGELHLYMEPLIPFAGSRLNQATAINVESGGRVYFWESFMAGRIGSGESWQFDELAAETSIRVNGQLLYIDRFQLTPQKRPLAGTWILDDARYVGSGLCVDERSSNLAGLLHDLMPAAGTDSPAAGLTIVRVTETDGPAFHAQRDAFMRGCLCGKL